MGVLGRCMGRGSVLVAVEVKQLSRVGTTGLADVMCSATKHPKTCLLLLMYKYTCMSTKSSTMFNAVMMEIQPSCKLELQYPHHDCA